MPLKNHNQWILHKDKKPLNPSNMQPHDPHDVAYHKSFEIARVQAQLLGAEVGFVLREDDPYWCLDIDGALVDGAWSPLAMELVNATAGCLVEVSRSGKGLHIWGRGTVPSDRMCKNTSLNIELYNTNRFIAWTGNVGAGGSEDCEIDLGPIVEKYFPRGVGEASGLVEWVDAPVGPIPDDDALIAKMLNSGGVAAAFGAKASVRDLWERTELAVEQYGGDLSSMDQALCMHLAFWTQKNPVRMERLFGQSALVRDKWLKREDYRQMTVSNACKLTGKVYKDSVKVEDSVTEGTIREGYQYMDHITQLDYFKGCAYVIQSGLVLLPNGEMVSPQKFKTIYGGYVFALDSIGDKTTRNAFEAFGESQAFHMPKVDRVAFAPERGAGELFNRGGYRYANSYVPVETERMKGDASPFVDHIHKLLPRGRDAEILLTYMAACIQHKGVKFQWAPVIQGTEGNGKTLIERVMRHCLSDRYCIVPNSTEIAGKFNGWLENKLFCFIDEIKIPSHRTEVLEALKPLVTNEVIAIERKGVDMYNGDNRANIIMATNHRDAIPVSVDQRRYAILYTAQQTKADMMKIGWNGTYFAKLYDWLRNGGYAIVNDYLSNYAISDELNPATGCQQAPRTSSTDEAIAETLGEVEQEIIEAIESERFGFKGGMVSMYHLDKLLTERRLDKKVKRNKRKALMESLGFFQHPETERGRTSRAVETDDNKRVQLMVKPELFNLSVPELTDLYVQKQTSTRNLFVVK